MATGFSFEEAKTPSVGFSFEEAKAARAAPTAPEDQSVFRQVADIPLKLAGGVTQGVRMIADTFGAGSETSKAIKNVEDWIGQFYSAQSKQDAKEIARLLDEAKDKGVLDQIKAGFKAFTTAPVDLVTSALGTSAPAIVAAVGATLGGAPIAASTALTLGVGAVMGAGGIKGTIYDATKEELVKAGVPEAQAEKQAELAQQYNGKNLDSILLGAGIGAVAGRTGLEPAIAKQMASRILGKAAATEAAKEAPEQVAKQQAREAVAQAAARGPVKQAAVVGSKEAGTEFGQAAQEKIAENIALQREGFDVPTFRGAVAAGTLEGLAGAGLGGAFGAREAIVAKEEQDKLDKLNQIKNITQQTADVTRTVDEQIAELSQKYQAQMPKELADEVARRQIESRTKNVEAAQAAGVEIPPFIKPDPQVIAEYEADLLRAKVSPATARLEAIQQATNDAYQTYLQEQSAKKAAEEKARAEAESVKGPVTPAGGESVSVAAKPDSQPPAPGTQVTEPVGVVSPATDVGIPAGGEAAKPAAVKEEGAPSAAETVETVKTKEEGPTTPVEGATVATTAAPFVGETRPTLAAPVKPLILADTLANAAFTTRDQVTGAADKFQQLDNSIQQRRQELEDTLIGVSAKPNVQKAALARFDAAVENLKTKEEFDPIGFARAQAQASFDQRNSPDYSSPEEAIDFGRDNVSDTLREQGVKDLRTNGIMDRAFRAYDEEIARLQGAAAPAAAPAKPSRPTKVTAEGEPKKAGRPKLTEEQREAATKKKREQKTAFERNKRAYNRAVELLADPDTRTEALHILKDLRSTSLRPQAQAAVAAAGVTPAEAKRIDDTHAEWRKQREEDKAVAAEEREEKAKDAEVKKAEREAKKAEREQKQAEALAAREKKQAERAARAEQEAEAKKQRQAKAAERKAAAPAVNKQKLSADQKVRSKQDALKKAKGDINKQIAQLELDEALVEQKLVDGAKLEDLGLSADWRDAVNKQISELKAKRYIAETNRILASNNPALLERLLFDLRIRLAKIKQDIAEGTHTEEGINWGNRWRADSPKLTVAEAQAEIDAIAARVQALPPVTGKGKAKAKKGLSQLDALNAEAEKAEKDAEDVIDGEKTAEDVEDEEKDEGLTGKLQFQATRANVSLANPDYKQDITGAQAAQRLARTASNMFQRMLAMRLSKLRVLQNVDFVVLEEGDEIPLELVRDLDGWSQARGVYIPETNTVYVKGTSYGYLQGVNNITILHELLHAALARKIALGKKAAANKKPLGDLKQIEALFRSLQDLGRKAEVYAYSMSDMSEDLALLFQNTGMSRDGRYNIFADPDEFLAYGMSDPLFQAFLKSVPVDVRTNGLSAFVRAIMRFLGLAQSDQSALTKLVDITDQYIKSPTSPKIEISGAMKQTAGQAQTKAKEKKVKTDKALEKAQKANVNSPSFLSALGDLITLREGSSELVADMLAARFGQIRDTTLRQLLPTLQTETLVQWAERLGINGIPRVWNAMKSENAMRYALINRSLPVADDLATLQRKDPGMFESLGVVMHYATLRGIDPATEEGRKKSPALKELWEKLTPEAQSLYVKVRDHYRAYNDLYHDSLVKRVEESQLDDDSKKELLASVRQIYETSNKIQPYFPLMRYGQYWVRIGKGKSGEFYMFESQAEKELFIKQWVREQVAKDPKTSREQLYTDGAIEDGNSLQDGRAQSNVASYNDALQKIFGIIDGAVKKPQMATDDFGNVVKTGVLVDDKRLKDDVYQLMLHTLPDRSFRRHFIHRKGKAGFSKDVARNFASLTMSMANQLARMRYSSAIEGALSESAASLQGNPDQAKLGEFVEEMRIRAQQLIDPAFDDSLSNRLANFTNTTAFLWLMTTIKTAVAQAAAIPVFAAPVLASKYGVFAAHTAIARFSSVWNSFGVREEHPDGSKSWVAPTVAQSKQVKMNDEERRAAQYMVDRGISDTTMAFDLGNRRELPTHVLNSTPRRVQRTVTQIMTGLFHNVERLNREITFMAAFRLARKKYPGESFEQIAARAEQDTYEAMGNFSSMNRPRGIGASAERQVLLNAHAPLGRSLLQFKMFPAFVTTYMVRNFWRVIGTGYSKEERKAAATQLFGTLGYSLTLAGIMGVPGVSFALGILAGLRNLNMDEDDEDELYKRDFEFWVRTVWLPETFGDTKVGGVSVAKLLDRGLLAELTGKDITSSLSFNNLWFPERKEQPTAAASMQDFFMSLLGPFVSLSVQQVPRAIDKLNQGKVLEGMEQLMPGFVRPTLTAYRFSEQGATAPTGALIKRAEEFTTGELIGQAMGFSTEGLVAQREALFKAESLKAKVMNERKQLIDRLGLDITRGSEDINVVFEKIAKFNRRNPNVAIAGDSITTALQNRFEKIYASERGLPIESKFYPLVRRLFDVPIEQLEKEAARK